MTAVLPAQFTETRAGEAVVRLDSIEDALAALRHGLPVIVVDDEDRENEGDIVMAAVHATPEWLAWTIRYSSGVVCAPMTDERADHLQLPPMVARNEESMRTAYTVSVDAKVGVGTGISATDRAFTLRLLADPTAVADDLVRPGHVFPLRSRPGGVLERPGHTEATTDLCRLAGLPEVGFISEVVEDDGTLMKLPALRRLADSRDLPLVSIEALAAYRRHHEPRVERVATTSLPTRHGTFEAIGYRDTETGDEHVALVNRPLRPGALVRVHSECLTGDALGSLRCDCGPQLEAAMQRVADEGGAVVYLRGHEGRGIGLLPKLAAYALQDDGLDTVAANVRQGLPVDAREYGAAAAVLTDLGLTRVTLLTNNPAKVDGLRELGIEIADTVALVAGVGDHNSAYLRSKRDLMGHQLDDIHFDDARLGDSRLENDDLEGDHP
jgi:3,4-dihydroxy 2-butanone 4-phosphate synthase / GTP cyclohydrolase II